MHLLINVDIEGNVLICTDLYSLVLFYFLVQILKKMKSMFIADWCSEEKCHSTIKDTLKRTGILTSC